MQIHLVNEEGSGKPRGYAFVEFQHTRDMKGEASPEVHWSSAAFGALRPSLMGKDTF